MNFWHHNKLCCFSIFKFKFYANLAAYYGWENKIIITQEKTFIFASIRVRTYNTKSYCSYVIEKKTPNVKYIDWTHEQKRYVLNYKINWNEINNLKQNITKYSSLDISKEYKRICSKNNTKWSAIIMN